MINKLLFFIKLIFIQGISKLKVLYLQIVYHGVSLPSRIIIPRGVVIATSGGGTISIGRNVTLCRDAQLISQGGQIRLDDNVHIGVGVIIVSLAAIDCYNDPSIGAFKKDSNLVERFFNKLKQFRCVASRHTSTHPVL